MFELGEKPTVQQLRRFEQIAWRSQWKRRYVRVLCRFVYPLFGTDGAPLGDQRVKFVPVPGTIGLRAESLLFAPVGVSHHTEPCLPLPIFTGRYRNETV